MLDDKRPRNGKIHHGQGRPHREEGVARRAYGEMWAIVQRCQVPRQSVRAERFS